MKFFIPLLFLLLYVLQATASPSDTIHVEKYVIQIDTIDYTAQSIKARTQLTVVSKQNGINSVSLDLLQMNVDSVYTTSGNLTFNYNSPLLVVQLPSILNLHDTCTFTVAYHGSPQKDASGWGGFYFFPNMAFNMGVGFAANPHNLGKVWFPCVDVFDDKSLYEYYITTPGNQKAFCNGYLNDSIILANGSIIWHWKMDDYIPTYLACMATGPYTTWSRNYGGIPIEIAALPTDTSAVSGTFINLPSAINQFVDYYGSYPFNKIGYSLVNFNAGAMEHATNIAIGKSFVNGTLGYETLWAHELSHMWWGDKVTCKTAEDMWLNEGWASFNEALFTEAVYGNTAYKNWIRTNHRKVLQFAHINDGSYLPLNNVPAAYTYGTTVYQKGADIVHTLRNYLGDSLFKAASQHYLDTFAYGNASSADMEVAFSNAANINCSRFFNDWIYTEGFPHFSIDSVVYWPGGLDHYFVYTRQRTKGNSGHVYAMPVEITFSNGTTDTTVLIQIDSVHQVFHIPLIIANADWIALDRNEKISDAISDYERTITTTGVMAMNETNTTLNVQSISTPSSIVRVEHHWVAPDGFKQSNPGVRLSDYHYWQVDGHFFPGFHSKITFLYDGSNNTTTGYIDNSLITGREDSLLLLYRMNTADDWQIINATHNMGSALDKKGSFTIDSLMKGEYVLGYRDYTLGMPSIHYPVGAVMTLKPNPAQNDFVIEVDPTYIDSGTIIITDTKGKQMKRLKLQMNQPLYHINCQNWANGEYLIQLNSSNALTYSHKILIQK